MEVSKNHCPFYPDEYWIEVERIKKIVDEIKNNNVVAGFNIFFTHEADEMAIIEQIRKQNDKKSV